MRGRRGHATRGIFRCSCEKGGGAYKCGNVQVVPEYPQACPYVSTTPCSKNCQVDFICRFICISQVVSFWGRRTPKSLRLDSPPYSSQDGTNAKYLWNPQGPLVVGACFAPWSANPLAHLNHWDGVTTTFTAAFMCIGQLPKCRAQTCAIIAFTAGFSTYAFSTATNELVSCDPHHH